MRSPSLTEQARYLNQLIQFLAKRDVARLTSEALLQTVGAAQVDLLILLGSGVIPVAEQAARAYQEGLAREILITGGIGHSTRYLGENVRRHPVYRTVAVDDRAEADILKDVLVQCLGVPERVILTETRSTNCGSNAEESWHVLAQSGKKPQSILLLQDPTMQLRTEASFRRVWGTQSRVTFVSYATVLPLVTVAGNALCFAEPTSGEAWEMDRFLSLVMGEIPRLTDDENGYGPRGKGFIAHVDIPPEIQMAYQRLLPVYREYQKSRTVN